MNAKTLITKKDINTSFDAKEIVIIIKRKIINVKKIFVWHRENTLKKLCLKKRGKNQW